ncbi:MAG: DUF459 domain-containing protein [Xanthobacteraceae bacterium]|nr:DUF459 domain-containing protein [Xanthobacteraceae bacterium]MCW5675029.1 DUF459 domain-containing protein [Xanthobacteraceae bacterium]
MKRLFVILLFAAVTAAASFAPSRQAAAQSPFTIFERLFGPRYQPEQEKPEDREPKEREDPTLGTVYNSANSADADTKRQQKPEEYVVVIGDTLADQLAQGLAETFFSERPEIAIIKKTRSSSGLVREDFYNWQKEAANIVANERATAFVVMLGLNDRQVLRDEAGSHEIRSERWREIYAKRVDDFLAKLKEKGTPVYLTGLPPTANQKLSADMEYINDILRERAARAGMLYIDVWEGFVDEQGQFVSSGAAMDGQTRRLRVSDGIHFTRAGARKFAHYVERDLIRLFDSRVRSPYLPYGVDLNPSTSGVKPIAGPVIPLNVPLGQTRILEGETKTANAPAFIDESTKKVLVDGLPPPPVNGRADDFRWPRPASFEKK